MKKFSFDKVILYITWGTIVFFILWALSMVIFEIRPFFLDEWAIIYNIKYKTYTQLWGQLDKTQQFPRLYLSLLKSFCEAFDYSYISLRLPSFIVHTLGLLFCFRLARSIYKDSVFYSCLFVLIYAAYPSSLFYYVLTKQYSMEMLLSLVGIAQLIFLLRLNAENKFSTTKYTLVCIICLAAPLFSYTYSILMAPAFCITLLSAKGKRSLLLQLLPATLISISTFILYQTDIKLVTTDAGMKNYWAGFFMKDGFSLLQLIKNIYLSFYNFGRGNFMAFVGVLGFASFLFGTIQSCKLLTVKSKTIMQWLVIYGTLLIWLSIALFVAGKLPLNAYRINAYKTAATGILIIYFFMQIEQSRWLYKPVCIIACVLFVLQLVFIIQPAIRELTESAHQKKLAIYRNTKHTIALAQQENIPILTTSMVLYPHDSIDKGDWVIRSYPAYKQTSGVNVYPIDSAENASQAMHALSIRKAVINTGDSTWISEY